MSNKPSLHEKLASERPRTAPEPGTAESLSETLRSRPRVVAGVLAVIAFAIVGSFVQFFVLHRFGFVAALIAAVVVARITSAALGSDDDEFDEDWDD